MSKTGECLGWEAIGRRLYRGRVQADHLGTFKTWREADAAADKYHSSHRQTYSVDIKKMYAAEEAAS